MDRIRTDVFTRDNKNFMYIDLSEFKTNEELTAITQDIGLEIAKYPPGSLYTITNIDNIRFDTESKAITAKYMEQNGPYVKYGAIIGLDGIKKIMAGLIFTMSGRKNMIFAYTKEQAVELLLRKE